MGKFKIRFKKSVSKDLRSIPNKDVKRILERILQLGNNPLPAGCEKLSGQERYRIRQGLYRIIYEIHNGELLITIIKIGHRSSIYKT